MEKNFVPGWTIFSVSPDRQDEIWTFLSYLDEILDFELMGGWVPTLGDVGFG